MKNRVRCVQSLAIAAAMADVALLAVGGTIKPGYSHIAHFISELNATGSSHAASIGLLGFVPVGLLVAAFLLMAAPLVSLSGLSRLGYWMLLSQPIAYVGAYVFPCDIGCPLEGSVSQRIHNVLGVITYIACAMAFPLLACAPSLRAWPHARYGLVAVGMLWLVGFFVMVSPQAMPWRGLIQRILEVSLYAGLLFIAFRMTGPSTSQIQS